ALRVHHARQSRAEGAPRRRRAGRGAHAATGHGSRERTGRHLGVDGRGAASPGRAAARREAPAVRSGLPCRPSGAPRHMPRSRLTGAGGARRLAFEVLLRVEATDAFADVLLAHRLADTALPPREHALATRLVYGTLAWQGRLDFHLGTLVRNVAVERLDPPVRAALRLGLYQLLFLDRVPAYAAVDASVRLARVAGAGAGGLVNAVDRHAAALRRLRAWGAGRFAFQGEVSQLIAPLLGAEPGRRFLDACAAPGGKTAHLGALAGGGTIVALDRRPAGVCRVLAETHRLGVSTVVAAAGDARRPPVAAPFDAVLSGAPCSGLGTLRRHPELRWRRRPEDVP